VEYHRHLGQLHADLHGHEFVMRASTIDYLAPAHFDDLLEIFVRLSRIGRTSATYECAAYRVDDDLLMVTARQTLVLVDLDERKAAPIPDLLREEIRRFEGEDVGGGEPGMSRIDAFRGALEAIERVLNRGGDADDVLRDVVGILYGRFDRYSWVGIYLVEEEDLVLGPWQGPEATDHVRIPVGQGICGAAAASGRTEIVDDVSADARYLACFASTRSEIVVPVIFQGRVVGEIDIDSDEQAAFDDADRTFLERVATLVSPYCLVGWDTGGVAWQP
jgi:L-methionine (R)-S-oxide reductase